MNGAGDFSPAFMSAQFLSIRTGSPLLPFSDLIPLSEEALRMGWRVGWDTLYDVWRGSAQYDQRPRTA